MKLHTLSILGFVASVLASPAPDANALKLMNQAQKFGMSVAQGGLKDIARTMEDEDIPGESPISLCDVEYEQLLEIKELSIDPNPPAKGQNLTINASGYLYEDVEEGAYIEVEVRYGYIRLISQTMDLCEQSEQVDWKCPIKQGDLKLNKQIELPNEIPPGKYVAVARAYTVDDDLITCLLTTVTFPASL